MSKVITVGPVPPEKLAYALARYSRSADSIADSINWVRDRDSGKFLESFYFQYGHASIADLGHLALCFEGISELAATEIEDEQLWDGQARSSRYQDFSTSGYVVPPGLTTPDQVNLYGSTADLMLECYQQVHEGMVRYYLDTLPRPDAMPEDAYLRAVKARAFDVARYLLFWGVPTGVGQVTSIRTLERQMARLRSTPYLELHMLANDVSAKLRVEPDITYDGNRSWRGDAEPLAPTLAKHLNHCDQHYVGAMTDLRHWIKSKPYGEAAIFKSLEPSVDVFIPKCAHRDIAATLLYPISEWSYKDLYMSISETHIKEVLDIVYTTREKSELLRSFRTQRYAFDITMDFGAYRDLHRHRRVQHFRKPYDASRGFSVPSQVAEADMLVEFETAIRAAENAFRLMPPVAREYILPFATQGRFLMKMDPAEVDYITRLRTGVKGHFSYRKIAWMMAEEFKRVEPVLGQYLEATSPDVIDELKR